MATKSSSKKTASKKSARRPIFTVDRSNMLRWILAAFLGLGLMFTLGVLVGRNQAPIHFDIKRLDEQLANLKDSILTTPIKRIDVIRNLKKNKLPEIQDHDPHTLSPKYAQKDNEKTPIPPEVFKAQNNAEAETNDPEPNKEKPVVEASESTSSEIETEGAKPDEEPAPTPVKKPSVPEQRSPEPAETVSPGYAKTDGYAETDGYAGTDGYAIQIASMSDPESAALIRDRFLAKGYPAYCRRADVNGQTVHRVRIGPYPSEDKARKDLKSLTDAGVSAIIFLAEGANF